MPLYQPGLGISNTAQLKAGDIGNVADPAKYKGGRTPIPPGTIGRLNTGLTLYGTTGQAGDPYTANDPLNPFKPSYGEIYGDTSKNPDGTFVNPLGRRGGLAELFGVGGRTVERWFDMYDKRGRREARNCVPVKALGKYPCRLDEGSLHRVIMAAALVLPGGFSRPPIFHKGDKKGRPILLTDKTGAIPLFATIAECVTYLFAIYDGTSIEGTFLQQGWVQMTIEPASGGGWNACVYRFYPFPGDMSDPEECPQE